MTPQNIDKYSNLNKKSSLVPRAAPGPVFHALSLTGGRSWRAIMPGCYFTRYYFSLTTVIGRAAVFSFTDVRVIEFNFILSGGSEEREGGAAGECGQSSETTRMMWNFYSCSFFLTFFLLPLQTYIIFLLPW